VHPHFVRAYPPAEPAPGEALWLPFRRGELLVRPNGAGVALARGEIGHLAALGAGEPLYLGSLGGVPCLACEVEPGDALPDDWRALGLRALYGQVEETPYLLAGYAFQLLAWRRTSRFCPACGEPTEPVAGDWARRCPRCGYTRYPPLSPAVLILVHDGDRILLGQKGDWGRRYSILAGFVEPGESLETCVRREVFEEVGIEIGEPVYHGSQPWPFPHQLMVGFWAPYQAGDLRPDPSELADARWFRHDDLPELPAPLSLSRQLIDAWVASRRGA
jgi:NAD+ diphosphatase